MNLSALKTTVQAPGKVIVSGAPEGIDGKLIGDIVRLAGERLVVHVARDDQRAAMIAEAI